MASTTDILGQIGAAKIFCSELSGSLGGEIDKNNKDIKELEEELKNEENEKKRKKIQKKIDRLKKSNAKKNKINEKVNNANDFLARLAEKVDIGRDDIINFLTKLIVELLPSIETAVKMVLLTNLKKMTSCAIDMNIPDTLRTDGMNVNLREVDIRNILLVSPTSKYGKYNYFGVDDITSSYQLAKAEDMNAFMWFVKNCAKFVQCVSTKGKVSNIFSEVSKEYLQEGYYKEKEGHKFTVGTTLKDSVNSNTIFLIDEVIHDTDDNSTTYHVTPVSNTWTSVNWYSNGAKLNVTSKKAVSVGSKRSKPLFRLKFSDTYNSSATLPLNNFQFTILPKPFEIGSSFLTDLGNDINVLADYTEGNVESLIASGITNAESTIKGMKWPSFSRILPKKARFGADGTYNKNGSFSINMSKFIASMIAVDVDDVVVYKFTPRNSSVSQVFYLIFDSIQDKFYLSNEVPTASDRHGQDHPLDVMEVSSALIECYMGKTVYEFNYDYLMSFKLFDAKVIASKVVASLENITMSGLNELAVNTLNNIVNNQNVAEAQRNQVYLETQINKMIQNILDEDTDEYTSCFYDFSNEDYINMEEETALKVINGTLVATEKLENLTTAFNLLDEYDTDASLNEQTEVIKKTLSTAFTTDGETLSVGNTSVQASNSSGAFDMISFIKQALNTITLEITYALLSPKVMMLLTVNQKLMNNDPLSLDKNYDFSVEDVIGSVKGILKTVISQIIDMIQKQLLELIMARISQIMSKYLASLGLEYVQKWTNLIKSLLSCFKLSNNKSKSNNSDITDAVAMAMSQVDYADLDELAGQIIPDTKNC